MHQQEIASGADGAPLTNRRQYINKKIYVERKEKNLLPRTLFCSEKHFALLMSFFKHH